MYKNGFCLKLLIIALISLVANLALAVNTLVIEDFSKGKTQKWVPKKKSSIKLIVNPEAKTMKVDLPNTGSNWVYCFLKEPVDLQKYPYIELNIRSFSQKSSTYYFYIQKKSKEHGSQTFYTIFKLKGKGFHKLLLNTNRLGKGSATAKRGYFVPRKGTKLETGGMLSRFTITSQKDGPDYEIKSIKMLSERPAKARKTYKQSGLVLYYDFEEKLGTEILDKSGNKNDGNIKGEYKWVKGRSGSGLQFNGLNTLVTTLDSKSLHITNELTVSLWVKPEAFNPIVERRGSVQSMVCKYWNWRFRINAKNQFRTACIIKVKGKNKDRFIDHTENKIKLNKWYKLTFVYSVKEKRFTLYVNNKKSKELRSNIIALRSEAGKPLHLGMNQGKYNPFKGVVDELYIYNRALSAEEIVGSKEKLSDNKLSGWESSVSASLKKINSIVASSSNNKEIAEQLKNRLISLQERLQKIKTKNIKLNLSKIEKMESSVNSIAAIVTALVQGNIKIKDIVTYDVEAVSSTIRTPDSSPTDGKISDTLRVILTPGEYEPASFVSYAFKDIKALKLKAGDLKSKNGTIPAKNIDIKIVKCWYQAGTAWGGIKQDKSKRILVPELLLNDDSLVKVDTETKDNYVKLKYPASKKSVIIMRKNGKNDHVGTKERLRNPSKTKYYWMSSEKAMVKGWQPNIKIEDFPIKDSPVLLALDLKKGKYQQFWITIKAPEDAKAGIYKSKIILSSQGKTLGHINLLVKVLPFKLARAMTRYDVTKKFIQGIYYHGMLTGDGKGSVGEFTKTKEQYEAEALNLYKHGILNPNFKQKDKFKKVSWLDKWAQLVKEQLAIRQKVGLELDPLFTGVGYNLTDEYKKNMLADQNTFDKIKKNAKRLRGVFDEYNIKDVYIYGIDEAAGKQLVSQRKIWDVIHKEGFKIYVAGYKGAAKKIGDILDIHICKLGPYPNEAEIMHKSGNKILQYHNPQGGVENPEMYRRNYGFLLWRANYDGAATYVYTSDFAHPWNDFDGEKYRDHNLVYPTANGVIDTIAWEGYREAMDDVRYISTLHQKILRAKKSRNQNKRKIALSAEKYLNKLDAAKSDLYLTRMEIIKYILQLKK